MLTLARFVDLIGDALLEHEGSGRQSFTRAREQGRCRRRTRVVREVTASPVSLIWGSLPKERPVAGAAAPQHLATALPASGSGPDGGGGRWQDAQAGASAYCRRGELQGKCMGPNYSWRLPVRALP